MFHTIINLPRIRYCNCGRAGERTEAKQNNTARRDGGRRRRQAKGTFQGISL